MVSKIGEYGYERRKEDDYFTAPWITEVLCKCLKIQNLKIWEPACGEIRKNLGFVAMLLRHEFDAPFSHWSMFAYPFQYKIILPRRPQWIEPGENEHSTGARFPYAWYYWNWLSDPTQNAQTLWVQDDGTLFHARATA